MAKEKVRLSHRPRGGEASKGEVSWWRTTWQVCLAYSGGLDTSCICKFTFKKSQRHWVLIIMCSAMVDWEGIRCKSTESHCVLFTNLAARHIFQMIGLSGVLSYLAGPEIRSASLETREDADSPRSSASWPMSVKKVRSSFFTHIYFLGLSKLWRIRPKLFLRFTSNTWCAEDFEAAKAKALKVGAVACYVEDLKREFIEELCFPAIQCNAIYENVYLLGKFLALTVVG